MVPCLQPTTPETYWGTSLPLIPSRFGTPSHCLSLATLACPFPPFQAALKLCQWAVLELFTLCEGKIWSGVRKQNFFPVLLFHWYQLCSHTLIQWTCLFLLSIGTEKIEEITTHAPDISTNFPRALKSLFDCLWTLLKCCQLEQPITDSNKRALLKTRELSGDVPYLSPWEIADFPGSWLQSTQQALHPP